MEMGRDFLPTEDVPGRDQVIILSHAFWLSHFSGDPKIVGKTVRIDGQPNEIIGVAPALANDPRTLSTAEIYRPLALTAEELKAGRTMPLTSSGAIVRDHRRSSRDPLFRDRGQSRRKRPEGIPGSEPAGGVARARASRHRPADCLHAHWPFWIRAPDCVREPGQSPAARAIARAREFAIRGALGASRAQLIRPLIAECGPPCGRRRRPRRPGFHLDQ